MQGKIFGIPLILILLVVSIAALVDIPMYAIMMRSTKKVEHMEVMMTEINAIEKMKLITPVITPSVTPTPSLKPGKTSTQSGVIK